MAIRVVAEKVVGMRAVDLYIVNEGAHTFALEAPDPAAAQVTFEPENMAHWIWREVDRGVRMPRALSMPDEIAVEVAKALMDVTPPDRAMQRHLDDAIKVRDRLLAMYEARGVR